MLGLFAPQLTAAWACAYFGTSVSLLVFGFGLLSLALQLSVKPEIRHLVHRYSGKLVRWSIRLHLIFLVACAATFVWFLHPCADSPGQTQDLASAAIVTSALVTTGIAWWLVLTRRLTDHTIKRLVADMCRSIRHGRPINQELADALIQIGAYSEPGAEKRKVLEAIWSVVDAATGEPPGANCAIALVEQLHKVFRHLCRRRSPDTDTATPTAGDEQKPRQAVGLLLRQIGRVLDRPVGRGGLDGGNLIRAVDLLRESTRRLGRWQFTSDVVDSEIGLNAVVELCIAAGEMEPVFAVLSSVNAPNLWLDIGLKAIGGNLPRLAVAALRKLEARAEVRPFLELDTVRECLALLAVFGVAGGPLAELVCRNFTRNRGCFRPSVDECITGSIAFFRRQQQFELADALLVLQSQTEVVALARPSCEGTCGWG